MKLQRNIHDNYTIFDHPTFTGSTMGGLAPMVDGVEAKHFRSTWMTIEKNAGIYENRFQARTLVLKQNLCQLY